jgi:hypothetical protein
MCLFWVSSLAYPNLLGTKGYVVVVVVEWNVLHDGRQPNKHVDKDAKRVILTQ